MKKAIGACLLLVLITSSGGSVLANQELSVEQVLRLVNQDRQKYDLRALNLSPTLNLAALAKAGDMLARGYFAHTSPSGQLPWYWFKTMGYNYTYAGENLALGFSDAYELENSWMSSQDHRANILSPHYSDLGLAIVKESNTILVVEFFGSQSSEVSLSK